MFGAHGKVEVCDGVYQIRVQIVKLDTISKDMLDRLFTKRVEKKLDYTDVTKDFDQFIEMLELSRSTTPGSSQSKYL